MRWRNVRTLSFLGRLVVRFSYLDSTSRRYENMHNERGGGKLMRPRPGRSGLGGNGDSEGKLFR
jgi:hypothetical protein